MKADYERVVQLLSPYGNWDHKHGMQVVDKTAAQKMSKAFMQGFDRFFGLPIYVGHPDEGKNAKRAKPVGKVEYVSMTEDGIAICAKYTKDAYEKLSKGKLQWLSPRWRMEELKDGSFRPVKLISVGMTNNPNIPGSGAILQGGAQVLKSFSKKTIQTMDACCELKKNISKCANTAARIKEESGRIKRERLDENLKAASEKPAPYELAQLALERAEKTGESYIESFAALRRQYYGKTKFGAHVRLSKQRKQ